jgi:hypothetical protein
MNFGLLYNFVRSQSRRAFAMMRLEAADAYVG